MSCRGAAAHVAGVSCAKGLSHAFPDRRSSGRNRHHGKQRTRGTLASVPFPGSSHHDLELLERCLARHQPKATIGMRHDSIGWQ